MITLNGTSAKDITWLPPGIRADGIPSSLWIPQQSLIPSGNSFGLSGMVTSAPPPVAEHDSETLATQHPVIRKGDVYHLLPTTIALTNLGTRICNNGLAILLKPGLEYSEATVFKHYRFSPAEMRFNPFLASTEKGFVTYFDAYEIDDAGSYATMPPSIPPSDANSYWKVLTQGGPLILAAFGDWERAHSTAASLYGAGTYGDDILRTQDPDSIMSLPMRFLVPGGHFGKELTPENKKELDMLSAQYAQAYFWGKILKYGLSIAANVAAMNRLATDTALSEQQRHEIAIKNYYDWIGNAAFGVEKACYAACLGSVGLAHYFGPQSPMWHVGYLSGAGILFGALGLATLAWWGKVKSGILMLDEERRNYMDALERGEQHHIDTGSLNVAFFNFANALPRMAKHAVAHASFFMLLSAFYAPQAFAGLRNMDYVSNAVEKLGGTGPEHIYRWMNFGFIVPTWLVISGALLAGIVPAIALRLQSSKTLTNIREHRALKKQLAELRAADTNPQSPEMAQIVSQLAILRREHAINILGIAGGVSILGAAFAVTYPALEPHALALTAMYGALTFAQITVRELETVKSMLYAAPGRIWNALRHPIATWNAWRVKRKERGGFWRRMRDGVRDARAIIKERKEQEKAVVAEMNFKERWKHRLSKWKESFRAWRTFFSSIRQQKQADKKLLQGSK